MTNASKILLIEDDAGIVMTLRRLLTDEGYEVLVEKRGGFFWSQTPGLGAKREVA